MVSLMDYDASFPLCSVDLPSSVSEALNLIMSVAITFSSNAIHLTPGYGIVEYFVKVELDLI